MANDSSRILVGGNGTIYTGPITCAAPTSAVSALATAEPNVATSTDYVEVGFVSESGVTVTPSQAVQPIMAWQSTYPVRKIITSRGLELEFKLREFNAASIPLAFGGGTMTDTGPLWTYVPPGPEDLDVRSMIIDWQDGIKNYRLYVPNGQIMDLSGFSVSRTAPTELGVKFSLNHDGVGDAWTLFSNDTGLVGS